MQVAYENFTDHNELFTSLESVFFDAAQFASRVGKDRLISISHADKVASTVITVWYWKDAA